MRLRRVLLAVLTSTCAGLMLACGIFVRNAAALEELHGAATWEELVATYRRAHEADDPEQILKLAHDPFTRGSSEYAANLRRLFRLQLDEVRFIPMPPGVVGGEAFYLVRKPDGESHVHSLVAAVQGKIVLSGRRPDGAAVTMDPGLVVLQYSGRSYLNPAPGILQLEVEAFEKGQPSVCRAIPFEADWEDTRKVRGFKDWEQANRQLDAIEQRIRARPQPKK